MENAKKLLDKIIEKRLALGQLESPSSGNVCHIEDVVEEDAADHQDRYSDISQAFVTTETNSEHFMRALRALKDGLLRDAEREAREGLRSVSGDGCICCSEA